MVSTDIVFIHYILRPHNLQGFISPIIMLYYDYKIAKYYKGY